MHLEEKGWTRRGHLELFSPLTAAQATLSYVSPACIQLREALTLTGAGLLESHI